MSVGFLRRRDPGYFTDENPSPTPVLGLRPGGSMYDIREAEIEESRAAEAEERRQFKQRLRDEETERDLERAREEEASREAWLREQARRELPPHLGGSRD